MLLGEVIEIAALERCKYRQRFAGLDENGKEKIWPVGKRCPLRDAALETGVWRRQICVGDDAQDVVSLLNALLHPGHNVAAAGNFPIVDMRIVAEFYEFMADPERPFPIAARIADQYVRHAPVLASPKPLGAIAR